MTRTLRMSRFLIILLVIIKFSSARDEIQFVFNGFHGAGLQRNGIAEILPNGLLQLTNSLRQKTGHAFYPYPLNFNTTSSSSKINQPYSFSTTFIFAIVSEYPTLGGHGLTFFLSPSLEFASQSSLPSQYLGLFNDSSHGVSSNHVFAVEFDTIQNSEFGDIDDNHVGIDVNSLVSIVSAPATYYSNAEGVNKSLQLISGDPIQAWIDYNSTDKLFRVTLAPLGIEKPIWPLLSSSIDLSKIILEYTYVGFSSSTGSLVTNHYILGWSFNRNGEAQELDPSKLPSLSQQRYPHPHKRPNPRILVPIIVPVASVLMTSAGILYIIIKKLKYEEVREDWEQEYGPQRFCYKDLYKATKGFRDRTLLGAGGFGKVYKGVLPSTNAEIAVKKISHESKQGMKEFVAEIVSMGKLRHRNLVQLLGYCRRKRELILVYDYMSNGSLDNFLFKNEEPKLNWALRYQIIKGIASGLLYLHEESEKVVLHRDIKASNVLLDAHFNPRLGDFGLARFYDHGAIPQTTNIVGTIGYLAPELTRTGKATTSSDVFAFGAFLLEMACGRRPIDAQRSTEEIILVDWVFEHWKQGRILHTTDPRLEGNYLPEQMEMILKLGLLCSHSNTQIRPCMRKVMQYLDGKEAFQDFLLDGAEVGMAAMGSEISAKFGIPLRRYSNHSASPSTNESILQVGR